jgi:hypothetical protein
VVAQKKLEDCHQLKYFEMKKPSSTLCVANQAEGAN